MEIYRLVGSAANFLNGNCYKSFFYLHVTPSYSWAFAATVPDVIMFSQKAANDSLFELTLKNEFSLHSECFSYIIIIIIAFDEIRPARCRQTWSLINNLFLQENVHQSGTYDG